MMIHRATLCGLLVGVICVSTTWAANDVLGLRKAARPLLAQERYEEAIEIYVQAGEQAEDDKLQAHCYLKASEIVQKRLDDTDRAMELAGRIRDPQRRASQELILLSNAERYDQVVERLGEAEIADWPMELHLNSYYARARAYLARDEHTEARDDLEAASRSHGNKGRLARACYELGQLYEGEPFEDMDKAMEAYKRGVEATQATYASRNNCFLRRGSILLDRGEAEKVLASFDEVDYPGLSSDYWRYRFYLLHARTHRELDNLGQAAQLLTKILRLPDVHDGGKAHAEAQIEELMSAME